MLLSCLLTSSLFRWHNIRTWRRKTSGSAPSVRSARQKGPRISQDGSKKCDVSSQCPQGRRDGAADDGNLQQAIWTALHRETHSRCRFPQNKPQLRKELFSCFSGRKAPSLSHGKQRQTLFRSERLHRALLHAGRRKRRMDSVKTRGHGLFRSRGQSRHR